jgi:hypothetical protein
MNFELLNVNNISKSLFNVLINVCPEIEFKGVSVSMFNDEQGSQLAVVVINSKGEGCHKIFRESDAFSLDFNGIIFDFIMFLNASQIKEVPRGFH